MFKIIGYGLGGIVVIFALGFIFTGGDLLTYAFFAPKYQKVQRQVFVNTPSYIAGKAEYLGKLRFQYQQATGDQKSALRSLIISESSSVDMNQMPTDIQGFVLSLEAQ